MQDIDLDLTLEDPPTSVNTGPGAGIDNILLVSGGNLILVSDVSDVLLRVE